MTSRRVLACAAACFALSAAAWGSEASADARDEAAVVQALQRWTEDFNARRADSVCDLFAPDLVADYRGQPTKTFDSLCPALQRDLSQGERSYAYRLEIHDVVVSGDMAAVRLTCT